MNFETKTGLSETLFAFLSTVNLTVSRATGMFTCSKFLLQRHQSPKLTGGLSAWEASTFDTRRKSVRQQISSHWFAQFFTGKSTASRFGFATWSYRTQLHLFRELWTCLTCSTLSLGQSQPHCRVYFRTAISTLPELDAAPCWSEIVQLRWPWPRQTWGYPC